jgi:hypothetical protein
VTGNVEAGLYQNPTTGAVVTVDAAGNVTPVQIDPRTGVPAIPYTNPQTGAVIPGLFFNPADGSVASIANGAVTPVTIDPATGLPSTVSPPHPHAREYAMLANALFFGNVYLSLYSWRRQVSLAAPQLENLDCEGEEETKTAFQGGVLDALLLYYVTEHVQPRLKLSQTLNIPQFYILSIIRKSFKTRGAGDKLHIARAITIRSNIRFITCIALACWDDVRKL